jgi:hypothetical protein
MKYNINLERQKKGPFRGNGTASNDCLPYEKVQKIRFFYIGLYLIAF